MPSIAAAGDSAYHLNDEVTNAFVAMLNRECIGSFGFVFSSHVFTALTAADSQLGDATIARLLNAAPSAEELLAHEQLLFVVNVPETATTSGHWYFIRASLAHSYVAAVDSCGGVHADAIVAVQRFLERLQAVRAEQQGQPPPSIAFTSEWRGASLQPPTTPSQPDAVSCGVYMLVGMWCCMSGVTLASRLDVRSVNFWRDVITLCLYQGGLR